MNLENLAKANELSGKINKLAALLAKLEPGKISLVISPNKTNDKIATIGCGDNCEHELAPLANDFLAAIRAYYQAQHDILATEFQAI